MSYHDLYITTATIPRTRLFNLPFALMVTCTRVGGWELLDCSKGIAEARILAGEYAGPAWLVLDVNGHTIVDSRRAADAQ